MYAVSLVMHSWGLVTCEKHFVMSRFLVQKFLECDVLGEKISKHAPIYIVTEGNEPAFFTRFFTWDPRKFAVSVPSVKSHRPFGFTRERSFTLVFADAW